VGSGYKALPADALCLLWLTVIRMATKAAVGRTSTPATTWQSFVVASICQHCECWQQQSSAK
jgi:hypothetical protein